MSREKGALAEERAARFLESLGYDILERNFRGRAGEIDLIARDADTVVFVEVRMRSDSSYGSPAETIGAQKRRKIVKTARAYAAGRRLDCPMRFDVVAIDGERLEHIPGAFDAGGF